MEENTNAVELAVEITTAWLANPNTRVTPDEVHAFLKNSHATLVGMTGPKVEAPQEAAPAPEEYQGAVSVRKSLSDPEVIYSMIDGKPYKALRRHLAGHGLTPETYRERYGLKADYPMVAPNYSKRRSEVAKELGLGRKRAVAAEASADDAVVADPKPETARKPRALRARKAAAETPEPVES